MIDFEELLANAHPAIAANQEQFKAIGASCQAIDAERKNVGAIVQRLRSEGITLDNWASFQVAKMLIQHTYPGVQARTLEKYTGHLSSNLQMPAELLPGSTTLQMSPQHQSKQVQRQLLCPLE
jgi:hypothetical protein